MQQRRGAHFRHKIEFVAGDGLLPVIYALAGVAQHFLDLVLRCIGKLLHQVEAVCKTKLRFVPLAGAAAGLIGCVNDTQFHSQTENVLAGLFPAHKVVAGAACKGGLVRIFAGAVKNTGFVFTVNAGRGGLALLGAGKALFFVSVCGMLCPGAEGGNHSHNGKPPFRVSLLS